MIRRLHLRNWRSYEDLDLAFDPGTTFVVAPNGVGKTSLVYGIAWAVFGQQSGINPKASIRAGADSAEVQVQLDLPDGRHLLLDRTVKHRGAPTATYSIDGAHLTERAALAELERAFGVELAVGARLSTMLGGAHLAAHAALNLESHLHHAFGIAHLLGAAETAESVAKQAERTRTALRSTTRQRLESRAPLLRARSPRPKRSSYGSRSAERNLSNSATQPQRSVLWWSATSRSLAHWNGTNDTEPNS